MRGVPAEVNMKDSRVVGVLVRCCAVTKADGVYMALVGSKSACDAQVAGGIPCSQ
jgi:hypothetical protein